MAALQARAEARQADRGTMPRVCVQPARGDAAKHSADRDGRDGRGAATGDTGRPEPGTPMTVGADRAPGTGAPAARQPGGIA
jgi:hypothetical protein